MKNWTGKKPEGEQWAEIGIVTAHGLDWGVSIQPFLPTGWATFKVYAIGKAPAKGNYWGAWNGERTSLTKDLGLMNETRPQLLQKLEHFLSTNARQKPHLKSVRKSLGAAMDRRSC
jgi:hypothetical protein